ncbi:MAG TPA: dihydroxy-acid dehydratase [Spirochaetota bacterium]|nr:dihydroxy-acid dehydratase [Spirochaetota bacterium]
MKKKSQAIFDTSDFPVGLMRTGIFRGTGADPDELKEKPMIAIVNSHTDINPGHIHLRELAQKVKDGVNAGGGVPFEFNVPAPCDGMTEGHEGMRYVLPQRDLIADMIETHMHSMMYDGMVMIASCDKIIPGMLIAAARLDLPAIFITGGPNSMHVRFLPSMKGSIDHKDYTTDYGAKLASATCATCGSCEVMGTANTMQSLVEAMGMCIPGSANVPAFHAEKSVFARKTGMRIVKMVEEDLTARKIMTKEALINALIVDLAIGGSTNTALHLPAIAHNLGIELPLTTFNEYNRKIPTLCSISPSGPHGMVDLYKAGGTMGVMKVLKDDLNLDCLLANNMKLRDILEFVIIKDETVIPPRERAFRKEGGTVILTGNLAPDGCVVKQSSVIPEMLTFTGPARVFESEHDALMAFREKKIQDESVLVIRNEGPRGGPGMQETLAITLAMDVSGLKHVAMITDGRFSGASAGPCIGHISPEAADGGPIAAVRDGDMITIDIPGRTLTVKLSDTEIKKRIADYQPPQRDVAASFMRRYIKHVSSAAQGAVLRD